MPANPRRSPTRLLAPIALAVFAIAFVVILGSSLGSGEGGSAGDGADSGEETTESTSTEGSSAEAPAEPLKRAYTVKAGDNLDLIAEKTGVPVEDLQELNPEVDPQALDIGAKITLRE